MWLHVTVGFIDPTLSVNVFVCLFLFSDIIKHLGEKWQSGYIPSIFKYIPRVVDSILSRGVSLYAWEMHLTLIYSPHPYLKGVPESAQGRLKCSERHQYTEPLETVNISCSLPLRLYHIFFILITKIMATGFFYLYFYQLFTLRMHSSLFTPFSFALSRKVERSFQLFTINLCSKWHILKKKSIDTKKC